MHTVPLLSNTVVLVHGVVVRSILTRTAKLMSHRDVPSGMTGSAGACYRVTQSAVIAPPQFHFLWTLPPYVYITLHLLLSSKASELWRHVRFVDTKQRFARICCLRLQGGTRIYQNSYKLIYVGRNILRDIWSGVRIPAGEELFLVSQTSRSLVEPHAVGTGAGPGPEFDLTFI